MVELSDKEFAQFRQFIHDAAGISLSDAKKILVRGRLAKRLQARRLNSYGAYFQLLSSGTEPAETQFAIDLLTTNETYFFREQKHFDLLRELAGEARRRATPFRVWSAAGSSGEEAYSIAMVLADCLGDRPWEVLASDISTRVLAQAKTAHYAETRTKNIPPDYLRRFCLKGTGEHQGTLLIDRALREHVSFMQINLTAPLPKIGSFDVIFLRNVMIYFNEETKRKVVASVLQNLNRGGHFLVGHSESLNGLTDAVQAEAAAIYRKS